MCGDLMTWYSSELSRVKNEKLEENIQKLKKRDRALDTHSGKGVNIYHGNIIEMGSTVILSRYYKEVVALDIDPEVVMILRRHLERMGIENVVVICTDYRDYISSNKLGFDFVNIDPAHLVHLGEDREDGIMLDKFLMRIPNSQLTIPTRQRSSKVFKNLFGFTPRKRDIEDLEIKMVKHYEELGLQAENLCRANGKFIRVGLRGVDSLDG